jgi:hypothetical protein
MYLIYAEATLRAGGSASSSDATALSYLQELLNRAFTSPTTLSTYDLDYILDERAHELYWDCHRRTDLIRYDRFTASDYLWEWKGGIQAGRAVDSHFSIYPLPSTDLMANTNLKQNDKY